MRHPPRMIGAPSGERSGDPISVRGPPPAATVVAFHAPQLVPDLGEVDVTGLDLAEHPLAALGYQDVEGRKELPTLRPVEAIAVCDEPESGGAVGRCPTQL